MLPPVPLEADTPELRASEPLLPEYAAPDLMEI